MIKKDIVVSKGKKLLDVIVDNNFSYATARKALRNKDIKVNGKACKENVKVEEGDVVTIYFKEDAQIKPYEIVFEDDDVVIVNKFSGVEVENGIDKLLNAYAVHRLDRNTEGLLVLAKTVEAKKLLEKAFKQHLIRKFYLAEVVGEFEVNKLFTAYLEKDSEKALVKVLPKKTENSVKIETYIKSVKVGKESSLVEVEIIGGKTHQIRAHLAYLGHAIIGDGKYGKREDYKKFKENKQKLFAYKLVFGNVGIAGLDGKEFKILPKWLKNVKVDIWL